MWPWVKISQLFECKVVTIFLLINLNMHLEAQRNPLIECCSPRGWGDTFLCARYMGESFQDHS